MINYNGNLTQNGGKRRNNYNPNRFNALDSALAYIVVLIAFVLLPRAISFAFRPFLRELAAFDVYAYLIVNVVLSQSIIFAVAIAFARIRKADPFEGGGYFFKYDGVQVLMSIVLTMGIMMAFYYSHLKFGSDAKMITDYFGSYDLKEVTTVYTPFFAIVYIVLTALTPAIVEEMLFRGIIMRGLEQFGSLFAVICSAAMFSLMHGNFSQMILQFLGGLAMGGVVMITKNYFLGSLMHFFNNIFAVAFGLFTNLEELGLPNEIAAVVDGACILIGIVCLVVGSAYFIKLAFSGYAAKKYGVEKQLKCGVYYKRSSLKTPDVVEEEDGAIAAEMTRRNSADDRTFYYYGKFRRLNRLASPVVSAVLLCVGLTMAVLIIFLSL